MALSLRNLLILNQLLSLMSGLYTMAIVPDYIPSVITVHTFEAILLASAWIAWVPCSSSSSISVTSLPWWEMALWIDFLNVLQLRPASLISKQIHVGRLFQISS